MNLDFKFKVTIICYCIVFICVFRLVYWIRYLGEFIWVFLVSVYLVSSWFFLGDIVI